LGRGGIFLNKHHVRMDPKPHQFPQPRWGEYKGK